MEEAHFPRSFRKSTMKNEIMMRKYVFITQSWFAVADDFAFYLDDLRVTRNE
jgi:hypothetical protein